MDAQVIPHGVDFVTKKQGNTCSGVSNQSLFWRQLQVEFFSKEGRQLRFDLFSLTFGTSEAQQEVSSPQESHPQALAEPYVKLGRPRASYLVSTFPTAPL